MYSRWHVDVCQWTSNLQTYQSNYKRHGFVTNRGQFVNAAVVDLFSNFDVSLSNETRKNVTRSYGRLAAYIQNRWKRSRNGCRFAFRSPLWEICIVLPSKNNPIKTWLIYTNIRPFIYLLPSNYFLGSYLYHINSSSSNYTSSPLKTADNVFM